MGQVFSTILSFSRSKAGKTALNSLHLLSGYVQLLTMDEKVLQNLFPETADQDEIRELKEKAASQELDLGMLKKGISLLLAGTIRQETDISLDKRSHEH